MTPHRVRMCFRKIGFRSCHRLQNNKNYLLLCVYMYMQIGMTIHCRILRVNLEKFSVDLTCKSSDLLDKEGRFRYVSTI
jgi:hypothetical protein